MTTSSTITIDVPRALELLRETVAHYGSETVYLAPNGGPCVYEHEGEPSCLIGCCLHRAGITVDQLRALDDQDRKAGKAITIAFLPAGVEITTDARLVLAAAQDHQDQNHSWGEALEHAEIQAAEAGGAS